MQRVGFLRALSVSCCLAALFSGGSAWAQSAISNDFRAALAEQADQLQIAQKLIASQQEQLFRQQEQLNALARALPGALSALDPDALAGLRAGQAQSQSARAPEVVAVSQPLEVGPRAEAEQPVGEAPVSAQPARDVPAIPEDMGVLTPRHRFLIDPSVDYSIASTNRLVFRGVEIVTGVQVGLLEASDVDRQTFAATAAARYGITDRLEVEVRVPYVARHDRVTTLVQRQDQVSQQMTLGGHDIGDVELIARYQFNEPKPGRPVFVGNLRYKSTTGKGPFDVDRDQFGVATELPTGSGFWGIEPSVTMLLPADPAVIFASVGYLYHAPDDVNRTFNGVQVGRVDPGDSYNIGLGFGFSVTPQFSFSLGYRHSYITPTETEFAGVRQRSDELQAGSLQFGWSYRLSERITFNNNFEFGVTPDAPDLRIVFRTPILF